METKVSLWIGIIIGALGIILFSNFLSNNFFIETPLTQTCAFMYPGIYNGFWIIVGFIILITILLCNKMIKRR